jgi:hypothetical protein
VTRWAEYSNGGAWAKPPTRSATSRSLIVEPA